MNEIGVVWLAMRCIESVAMPSSRNWAITLSPASSSPTHPMNDAVAAQSHHGRSSVRCDTSTDREMARGGVLALVRRQRIDLEDVVEGDDSGTGDQGATSLHFHSSTMRIAVHGWTGSEDPSVAVVVRSA